VQVTDAIWKHRMSDCVRKCDCSTSTCLVAKEHLALSQHLIKEKNMLSSQRVTVSENVTVLLQHVLWQKNIMHYLSIWSKEKNMLSSQSRMINNYDSYFLHCVWIMLISSILLFLNLPCYLGATKPHPLVLCSLHLYYSWLFHICF
jgi:hypothetical protein